MGGETFSQPNTGIMPFGRGFIIDQEGKVVKAYFGHQPQMAISKIYDLLDTPSSVEKLEIIESISVYPNPVVDVLTINLAQMNVPTEVSLYNSMGQLMKYVMLNSSGPTEIQFSDMPSGVYFVNVTIDGKNLTQTVIK